MLESRVTLFAGHYGSGKTNLAVNYARRLARDGRAVTLADLDIVNPYFRAKDSEALLRQEGIRLLSSPYANSNVDIPALPQEMYAVIDDRSRYAVLDIGGDDRGALALGRYAPGILAEGRYEMLLVLREIQRAAGIPFTAIVNNSNLGPETTAETVLASLPYAEQLSRDTGLPVKLTAADARLAPALEGKVPGLLFPLELQRKDFL